MHVRRSVAACAVIPLLALTALVFAPQPAAEQPARSASAWQWPSIALPAVVPVATSTSAPKPVAQARRQTRAVSGKAREPLRRQPTAAQWAALRNCESGGHGLYRADTGNGFYGAYQAKSSTWGGYAGYAEADQAPAAVQDEWARKLYALRGSRPWPRCGRHLWS